MGLCAVDIYLINVYEFNCLINVFILTGTHIYQCVTVTILFEFDSLD